MSKQPAKYHPHRSGIAGFALGTLLAYSAAPALSALGIPQDERDLARKTIDFSVLHDDPSLGKYREALDDMTYKFIVKKDMAQCVQLPFWAAACQFKPDMMKITELVTYLGVVKSALKTNHPDIPHARQTAVAPKL